MIYAEFIERDRSMPIEIFHFLGDQASWKDPEDRLFASLARTMRLGPQPDNMAFWQCRGMARLEGHLGRAILTCGESVRPASAGGRGSSFRWGDQDEARKGLLVCGVIDFGGRGLLSAPTARE